MSAVKAIDLFAGMGGFTEGAAAAGVRVVWAANHWRAAVDCHAQNHPGVAHACQDLQQANWSEVPRHDALLASPSCQGHSPARGKERPHHDAARATAWAVVSCAEVHRPGLVVCENVPAWAKWVLWPAWCQAMTALGYAISPIVVDAADYGVPQNRERIIVVCTRSKYPLELKSRSCRHRTANEFIDWEGGAWRKIDSKLSAATRRRIAAGRAAHGERFLAPYYGNGSGLTGRSIHRPVGTITTKDRWAVVDGDRMRILNVQECRAAMGFRSDYVLPANVHLAKHMLGNAIPPPLATGILTDVLRAA